jgi:hypothetical protein
MCEGMWRFGRLLVCHHDVYFPDRCVKSNDPVGSRRVKVTLKWHHPFLNLLHGAAYAAVSKSQTLAVTLHVGLCPRCRQTYKRIQPVLIAWLGTSLAALLLGVFWKSLTISGYLAIGGSLGLVFGYLVDRWFGRILTVKEINSRYVWLHGASPAFLAELPEWLGGKSR